jgi:hypothetical protein
MGGDKRATIGAVGSRRLRLAPGPQDTPNRC